MIRFSGDIRRDFDKATAEISKLKDRILGYQEKISNLRETEKRLRKANASQKEKYEEALTERTPSLRNSRIVLPMQKHFLTTIALIPVLQQVRHRQTKTKSYRIHAVAPANQKAGRKDTKKHPFRNRMKMMLPTTLSIPSRMMSAAQNAALLNALLPENLRSNMNTMYVSKS